jgi:hypothetical protein
MANERRKNLRLGLAMPVRVQGFLADGSTWEEFSTTDDVSEGGACFALGHDVDLGQVLRLSLGLPKRLRQFDLNDTTYSVYALVRGQRRRTDQVRVGVMFFGKYPPRGFEERPAARYLLPSDSLASTQVPQGLRDGDVSPSLESAPARPATPPPPTPSVPKVEFLPTQEVPEDRRAHPRMDVFINFTLQQVDEWGMVLQEELTVADNVSRGGARVMTTLGFAVGDVIILQEAGGGFATRAEVRGITRSQPSIDRLHLRFVDRMAPERLFRQ